jgi:hypothetical protein
MNHRRGQRWETELPIRFRHQDAFSAQHALLLELSYHGARIRLFDWAVAPGEVIGVWLPGRGIPIQAMVVHVGDQGAGLLWIDRAAWMDYLLSHSIDSPAQQSLTLTR